MSLGHTTTGMKPLQLRPVTATKDFEQRSEHSAYTLNNKTTRQSGGWENTSSLCLRVEVGWEGEDEGRRV